MKDLDSLIKLINSYPSDIKAEVLMADLMLGGLPSSGFLVFFDSLFKRGYSKDILKADKTVISDAEETLAIYLSRDGLYDLLPEGLFHTSPESALTSGTGMATDSRKESMIEKETRRFFQPFENELFYQRVQLELRERSILEKLSDYNLDDFFLDFWKIDRSLPDNLIIKLSAMLPFVKEIAGDFDMTASCLGAILGEKVTYNIYTSSTCKTTNGYFCPENECSLGSAELGVSLVTGGLSFESCKIIRFVVGPLKHTGIEPYLKNGEITQFIECFCSFFLPLEMDYEFGLNMQNDLQSFMIGTDKAQSVMGYSTII
jgi:hypothetical protein